MIKKQMWRYYCEHCNKSGASGGHMKKHEKHCTMNPDRECGLCAIAGNKPAPTAKLIKAIDKGMKVLSKTAKGCPACILAAIRQANLHEIINYDYQAEKKIFFAKHTPEAP